jgi:acyl dehydratase
MTVPGGNQPSVPASAAPRPVRLDGLWLGDLTVGQRFTAGGYELTEPEIIEFAARYDPQAYHLDPEAAKGTFFGGLVASGWHTAAVSMWLFVRALPIATGNIGAGGEVTWPSAAVAGDVLHLEGTIDDIVASRSRPGRAALLISHQTLNQRGEVRQKTSARLIAWSRPGAAAESRSGQSASVPAPPSSS